ncbi:MAG: hypothetical protein LBO66_10770 [Deltaproteobacteria bacterium]|jgi:hypothetical protein|nr:hypothetical protein [Deltaproteobacteria bacterium]
MTQNPIIPPWLESSIAVSPTLENFGDLPQWDAALTTICRSPTNLTDRGPAASTLAARSDRLAILSRFEAICGLKESWFEPPMLNADHFYNIETCIWKLSRTLPLETTAVGQDGARVDVPTDAEIMRIKSALVILRNSMRDYLDLAIFSSGIGSLKSMEALKDLDRICPIDSEGTVSMQLAMLLSSPRPFDLSVASLEACRSVAPEWRIWDRTVIALRKLAIDVFDASCQGFTPRPYDPEWNHD